MLPGMMGIMFHELGWIVTVVCCTSTVVAISLTPMLCSKLLKAKKVHVDEEGNLVDDEAGKKSFYERTVVRMLDKIDGYYAKSLGWCLKHKLVTFLILLAFFIVSLMPMFTGKIGMDFMQEQDNGRLSVTVKLQRGTRIEETLKTARTLEKNSINAQKRNIELATNSLKVLLDVPVETELVLTEELDAVLSPERVLTLLGENFAIENNLDYQLLQKNLA